MPKIPDTSEEGLERLRAAVRANPRSTTFVALAHRLCEAGRAAEAEEVCREGLTQHPGLVTGQVALGRCLLSRGQLREAQETLIGAAKANPDHSDAFYWLGDVVMKHGDPARARVLLEYAEELSPNDRKVTDLLIEAGGTPTFRSPRLKTDFEHTRVGDARALADRMHEDPGEETTHVGARTAEMAAGMLEPPPLEPPTLETPPAVPATPANFASPSQSSAQNWRISRAQTPLIPAGPRLPGLSNLPFSAASDSPPPSVEPSARPLTPLVARREEVFFGLDRRRLALGAGIILVAALTVAIAVVATRGDSGPAAELRKKMGLAVSAGSLKSLIEAREAGQQILVMDPNDGDALAALAFVEILLSRDYGLPVRRDAEQILARAQSVGSPSPARAGMMEATRSMLALGSGELAEGQRASQRALAATPEGAPALLASARAKLQDANLTGAGEDLDRILARMPEFSAAVVDRAAVSIDLGDAATAADSLRRLIQRRPDHVRARLLLAEAQRALGEPFNAGLGPACQAEAKQSPAIRAGCALFVAAQARLDGDKAASLKSARIAASEAPDEPRLLASTALALSVLGDIDAGAETLARAKRFARDGAVPVAWADLGVRLGRRMAVSMGAFTRSPAGPERRLVAARAILATDGPEAFSRMLKATPPGLVTFDPDLRALALLAPDRATSRAERADVDKRAEHGDPVAAYVLGRLTDRSDAKLAVRRLEKALWGHGDACEAAGLYRAALSQVDPSATPARPFRELRARNGECAALQP